MASALKKLSAKKLNLENRFLRLSHDKLGERDLQDLGFVLTLAPRALVKELKLLELPREALQHLGQ